MSEVSNLEEAQKGLAQAIIVLLRTKGLLDSRSYPGKGFANDIDSIVAYISNLMGKIEVVRRGVMADG